MTTVVNANPFAPSKLKIKSVGIGIEDDTNQTLNLTQTQAIIAGERRYVPSGCNQEIRTFGMIVDKEGVGINMTLEDRAAARNNYALYVDGSVFVTGVLAASNIVGFGAAAGVSGGSNYWAMGDRETHNIYYPGGVTIGNNSSTRYNQYSLNIVQSADRNIDHAQVSVQNTAAAQIRMGIVGTSNISPAIVNTCPGVPIEFHAARNQSYFQDVYKQWSYENGVLCNVPAEVPYYASPSNAPHLVIDAKGNVGVHTSAPPRFDFEIRKPNPADPRSIIIQDVTDDMNFSVHGNAYASNLLIWDYETGTAQNVDSMYIRKVGVTLKANQIIPGEFAFGRYKFLNGIDVIDTVNITGSNIVNGDLVVTQTTNVNHLSAYDATVFDVAHFRNDIYINRDVVVEESIRLRGGLFTEVPDVSGSNMVWCNIQFTVAQDGFSNINYYGAGFTTPGRVGIGAISTDEINNQLVINKRSTGRMYELELSSPSPRLIRSAYIGHPTVAPGVLSSDIYQDASLVFATPDSHDTDYNLFGYGNAPQNFYFFPGGYNTVMSSSIITASNPPVLNVNTLKRVGINTYDPMTDLDVNGSIRFSCNIYNGSDKLGAWREHPISIAGGGSFIGLEYYNPGVCSNVGVNAVAEPAFGMVVGGGLKSVNGYYTNLNEKIVPWINSETSQYATIGSTPVRMFTFAKAGMGVKIPNDTLELKDQYSPKTTIRLWRPERFGDNDPISSIEFDGLYSPWIIQHNDLKQTLEFGYGSNTFDNYTNRRAMWMVRKPSGVQQVVVGGNLLSADSTANPNPEAALVVDGGLSVIGDVNITGRYMIRSVALQNSNVNSNILPPTVGNEDVYISGKRVFVNPVEMLAVGYTDTRITEEIGRSAVFRVYQSNKAESVIARFICEGSDGFIEVMNTLGQNVKIGFKKDWDGFSIWNKYGVPYMTFSSNVNTGENMFSINTIKPVSANLHIQTSGLGADMFKLTRYFATPTTGRDAPEMELENRFENDSTLPFYNKWTLRGPDSTFHHKFCILYSEQDSGIKNELYTFTNDGRLGIGNTQPEFALDVTAAGDAGALRIYNPTNNGAPQIILQAGDDRYGYDSTNDYRIVAQANTFTLDAKSAAETKKLLYFDDNHNLGILGESASNFDVQVNGSLNVTKTIYIDGSPLFDTSGSGASEGFSLTGVNIFITPKISYDGGVYINKKVPCSNLFHINAASNANIAVFDSPIYDESQIHFRGLAQSNTTRYNIYRLQQSNLYFQIEHNPNSGTNPHISASHVDYNSVVRWGPSSRLSNEYDVDMWGSVEMHSEAPTLTMATSVIGHLNNNLYMISPSNVGVGSTAPEAKLDVYADKQVVGLRVRQTSLNRDIARFINSGGSQVFAIADNGTTWADGSMIFSCEGGATTNMVVSAATKNVGIATSTPSALYKLDVFGGARLRTLLSFQGLAGASSNCVISLRAKGGKDPVASNTDFMGLGVDTMNLRYHVESNVCSHVFYADATEVVRVTGFGNVGIGTTMPAEKLDVAGNIVATGDIYPAMNTLQNVGGPFKRWRDIYAANTIDLSGTTFTVNNFGHLEVKSAGEATKVIAKSFVMSDVQKGSNIEMIIGTNDPIIFNETNTQGLITNQYVPFLRSATTGGISVGTTAPEGVLHIVGHSGLPTMVIDHDSSSNTSNIVDIRDNGTSFVSFAKGGNVGIGSTKPNAKLDVVGQIRVVGSAVVSGSVGNSGGLVVSTSGNVGIGTANPLDILHVEGTQTFNGVSRFKENVFMEKDIDVRGNSYVHGDQTTDSDRRLKSDIKEIRGALDKVRALTGYTFVKRDANARGTGLIAQDVQKVLPEVVLTNPETGYLSVAYGNMMGLIIEAIKELDDKIEKLSERCLDN